MLKAFVGVASKYGLSLFQPERAETLSLVRRSVRRGGRRVGFWVVVNDFEAGCIQSLFHNGHQREAMIALDRCARDIGPILPRDSNGSSIQ